MWNVIKFIVVLVCGFYVIKFTFSIIGGIFSLLASSGSAWLIIVLVLAAFLVGKYWDDIVFEYEYRTDKYKKKKKESPTFTYNNTPQTISQQTTNTSTSQNQQSSNTGNTERQLKPDGTFTYVNGKYEDYIHKKQEMGMRWAAMLRASNLSEFEQGLAGFLGPNWYPSAYSCDRCGNQLYKTVFPIGKEFHIYATGQGDWKIKRAFTCLNCEIIYAPKPGHRYTEEYTEYKAPNEQVYREKTTMMGIYGTTEGREDV